MIGPLHIRIIAAESVPGGRAIALCTEDGEMIGRQFACTVEHEAGEIGRLHVSFHIDGETLIWADNDAR